MSSEQTKETIQAFGTPFRLTTSSIEKFVGTGATWKYISVVLGDELGVWVAEAPKAGKAAEHEQIFLASLADLGLTFNDSKLVSLINAGDAQTDGSDIITLSRVRDSGDSIKKLVQGQPTREEFGTFNSPKANQATVDHINGLSKKADAEWNDN